MPYASLLQAKFGAARAKGAVLLALGSLLKAGSFLKDIGGGDSTDGRDAHNDSNESSEELHGDGVG